MTMRMIPASFMAVLRLGLNRADELVLEQVDDGEDREGDSEEPKEEEGSAAAEGFFGLGFHGGFGLRFICWWNWLW